MNFLGRVLQGIDRVFDLEGSQLPTSQIDADPLQAVFDAAPGAVSERIAQLTVDGASNVSHWNGLPRFTVLVTLHVTADGTTVKSTQDPFAFYENTSSAATKNAAVDSVELWLMDAYMWGDSSNALTISSVTAGISRRSMSQSSSSLTEIPPVPVFTGISRSDKLDSITEGGFYFINTNRSSPYVHPLPIQLFKNPNTGMQDFLAANARSTAGGAAGQYVYAAFEILAVPKNSIDPRRL